MTLKEAKNHVAIEAGFKDWDHVLLADMADKITTYEAEALYDIATELLAKSREKDAAKIGIDALHGIMVMSASIGTPQALFTESDILKEASEATKKLMSL